jgi:hypothetical protein
MEEEDHCEGQVSREEALGRKEEEAKTVEGGRLCISRDWSYLWPLVLLYVT